MLHLNYVERENKMNTNTSECKYVYHYVHYTNQVSQIQLFHDANHAWNEIACFLKLRIGDAEYFGTATRNEHTMRQLLQIGRVQEACEIFNSMQNVERIEVRIVKIA
jgi:hypothetical protein